LTHAKSYLTVVWGKLKMKTRKKAIIATAMIASGIGMLSAAAPLYAASDRSRAVCPGAAG
jgi:hypothetical protein